MFKITNLRFYLRINKIKNVHNLKKATYKVVTVKIVKYLEMLFSLFKIYIIKFFMNKLFIKLYFASYGKFYFLR